MMPKAHRVAKAKAANPAAIYNEKRRIVLAGFLKNPHEARKWLDNYKADLGPRGYAGLKAELDFFERYEKELSLRPALDAGESADFSGNIDGQMVSFDVTTNIDYKNLAKYEPMQARGWRYKIAVFDGKTFEIVDINFPFCDDCKTGRVLSTAMLLDENFSADGDSLWSNDQLCVTVCSGCQAVNVADRATTPFLYGYDHWYRTLNEANNEAEELRAPTLDIEEEILDYSLSVLRYLRNQWGTYLVGAGSRQYKITNPTDADGYWTYQLPYIAPLAKEYLLTEYEWNIETT